MFAPRSRVPLVAVMVFCGACQPTPADAPAAIKQEAAQDGNIAVMEMAGYELLPKTLTVKVGQTVRFRNRNSEDFERAGFYTVACDIHPMMRADILVIER